MYLDDVLLYSADVASHKALLRKVFAILCKHKLFVKPEKCSLFMRQEEFLGHVIDANGVSA